MKKLLILFLGLFLMMPTAVRAENSSIQSFDETGSISNNGPRIKISYEGEEADVYYGSSGINIITSAAKIHLDTNFGVVKLVSAGDIDKDGYVDFLTYQSAPDFTSQILTVSGKDGKVISSLSLTRQGYHRTLGTIQTNSYIQQLLSLDNGEALIVYDYSIIKLNLSTAEIIREYKESDNIWKAVLINDRNGDGVKEIAYSNQQSVLGIIDGETLESLYREELPERTSVGNRWNREMPKVEAKLNLWDLAYDADTLYVTGEMGSLYKVNTSEENISYERLALEVITEEQLTDALSDQLDWINGKMVYRPSSVLSWQYFGYKIAAVNEKYILINCYLGDINGATSEPGAKSAYPQAVVVVDKESFSVAAKVSLDQFNLKFETTCFGVYKDKPVMMVVSNASEGSCRIHLYSLENSEIVYQKDVNISIINEERAVVCSWDGSQYIIEVLGYGCVYLDENLKIKDYGYTTVSNNLIYAKGEYNAVVYSTNGKKDRLVCYGADLKTVLWTFKIPTHYANKGIESIKTSFDYNDDGVNDIAFIINETKNDSVICSVAYVLNVKDGKAFFANYFVTGSYYENKKKITTYLTATEIDVLKDFDKDGKKELSLDGNVISSKSRKIIGNVNANVDTSAELLKVGDINKDGIADYVALAPTAARVYLSSASYSYGSVSCEYKKTNTVISLNKANDPVNTSVIFGDVNRDGILDIGMAERNSKGQTIYKVISGANLSTLLTLCPDGVNDEGEAFIPLNIDLNGDGRNEIYGRDGGLYGIYDGKSGEKLYDTTYEEDRQKYVEDNKYFPDYVVPFHKLEDLPNFVFIDDVNNDGQKDIAILKLKEEMSVNSYSSTSSIDLVDSKTFELIKKIPFKKGYVNLGALIMAENSDRLLMMSTEENSTLIDLDSQAILASYNIIVKTAYKYGEDKILVTDKDDQLLILDTSKSFDVDVEIPETIDSNVLELKWTPKISNSVMTIEDNSNIIYIGNAKEFSAKLMQGEHEITLLMDDGQGKTYRESYNVSVSPQVNNQYWLIGLVAILAVLGFLFGSYQKIRINSLFRKGIAK